MSSSDDSSESKFTNYAKLPLKEYDPRDYIQLIENLGSKLLTCNDLDEIVSHAETIARSENPHATIQTYVEMILSSRVKSNEEEKKKESSGSYSSSLDTLVVTAASNAITILNYGNILNLFKFVMSQVNDWSYCRFPDADLSCAVLDQCRFDHADLSRVMLFNASLGEGTSLGAAKLTNARLHPQHHPLNDLLMGPITRRLSDAFLEIAPMTCWLSSDGTLLLREALATITDGANPYQRDYDLVRLPEGQILSTFPIERLFTVAMSPDGQFIVCGTSKQTLVFYEIATGTIQTVQVPFQGPAEFEVLPAGICADIRTIVFSNNSSNSAADGGFLMATVAVEQGTSGYHGRCECCSSWQNERPTVSCLTVWKNNGRTPYWFIPLQGTMGSVTFSSDSTLLAVATNEGLMCWDMFTRTRLCELQELDTDYCISFWPNSHVLTFDWAWGTACESTVKLLDMGQYMAATTTTTATTPEDGSTTAARASRRRLGPLPPSIQSTARVTASELIRLIQSSRGCFDEVVWRLPIAGSQVELATNEVDIWRLFRKREVTLPYPDGLVLELECSRDTSQYFLCKYRNQEALVLQRSELESLLEWSYRVHGHVSRIRQGKAVERATA